MSPEQVQEIAFDERSDIVRGCLPVRGAAIREPFRGRTIDETFNNIKNLQIDPLSVRSPIGESQKADEVVTRALQKRPSDRYQSMREMIAEMRARGLRAVNAMQPDFASNIVTGVFTLFPGSAITAPRRAADLLRAHHAGRLRDRQCP